eukprot:9625444-Ditylum_brightwellii.AAC.1
MMTPSKEGLKQQNILPNDVTREDNIHERTEPPKMDKLIIPVPTVPSDTIGDVVWQALEEQNIIDWDNFMKGRTVSSWMEAQRQYVLAVDQNHKERDFNQDQWSTQLVMAIWLIFRQIWNARNVHLHMEMTQSEIS